MIKTLGRKKAVDLMLHHGGIMKQMHGPRGSEHFVIVPGNVGAGGSVSDVVAQEIKIRAEIAEFDCGLFPNNPQSWKRG